MAITNASTLAEYASGISTQGATLTVDANNKRVGIGTTNPQAMLQVGTGVTVFGNAGIASFTSLKLSGDTDSTSTSTGALTVTGGVGIGLSLTVGGDVSVGGTITYEDVTNVDSLGIVTARSGLRVVGGGITCVGVATFSNNIRAENGVHIVGGGLTCLGIGTFFNDVTVGAGNSVGIGSDDPAEHLDILNTSANANIRLRNTTNSFNTFIFDTNRTSADDNLSLIDARWNGTVVNRIQFKTGSDTTNKDDGYMAFHTRTSGSALAERVRIASDGLVGIGTNANWSVWDLQVKGGVGISSGTTGHQALSMTKDSIQSLVIGSGYTKLKLNPDGGQVLIGTSDIDPVSDGEVSKLIIKGTDSTASASFTRHSANAGGTGLYLGKSRNATIGSNTIVQDDDELGRITFSGDDGTDINTMGAKIASYVDGTPGSNDMPGRLVFYTTADGAATVTERMRINANGDIGINQSTPRTITGYKGITINHATHGGFIQFQEDGTNKSSVLGGPNSLNIQTQTAIPIYFYTNGENERLRIQSTGKSSFSYDATPADAQYGQIEISKSGSSNADPDWSYLSFHRVGQIAWQQGIDTNAFVIAKAGGSARDTLQTEYLRILSTGEIGIGLTNPAKTGIQNNVKVLQLDGGDGAELILGNSQSSNVSTNHIGAIAFKNIDSSTGNAPHYAGIRCNCTDTSGSMNLKFYAGGSGTTGFEDDTPDLSIDSLGNVGINVTDPNEILDVRDTGTARFLLRSDAHTANNGARIDFGVGVAAPSSGNIAATVHGNVVNTGGAMQGELKFYTNPGDNLTERMKIDKDGKTTWPGTISWALVDQTTVTTTLSSGLSDGSWQTVISSGVFSHQGLYAVSIFWNYNGQGGAPYYAQGAFMYMGTACNDSAGTTTNNIEDLVTTCHVGGDYYLSVRGFTVSSSTTGLQCRINGWTASANSEFIVKYKRIW